MTEKEFFDYLLETYAEKTGRDLPAESMGYYLEYFLDNYPPEKLELKLTKKICARIFHEFMINILKIPDVDWKKAGELKDIYDCRVCANAIAQVYERGIMSEAKEKVFGLNELVSKEDAVKYVNLFLNLAEAGNESECNIDA
ncbi:MAG: hypothetical protein K6F75_14085 [Butyrivibrio sp.]|nr:hypothetical protein [Butyrivibrio sp.]